MTDARRRLPSISRLLEDAKERGLGERWSRSDLTEAARSVVETARNAAEMPRGGWVDALEAWLTDRDRRSLRPVVNATGVPLHTNLGRAPLADVARDAIAGVMGYSTLELDLEAGERGSRQDHVRGVLSALTGAADALVVNNAASALLLVLSALGHRGETIVSRGELVEIGGAFRIPDILAQSGSVLVEVGTTNRTRIRDYVLAVSPRTKLLLKIHRSNFSLRGFVAEAKVDELTAVGEPRGIPVVHDVGSGLLISLEPYGLHGEPLVAPSAKAGAIVVFSGDKLVGGPQAGIIVGPRPSLEIIRQHPLARAVRADKVTLAGLEATVRLYREPERAVREIPVLRMLTADVETLRRRARRLARKIPGARTVTGESMVGGGAFPDCPLPTMLVLVEVPSVERALGAMREGDPPVIGRVLDDALALDVRTIADAEFPAVVRAVTEAVAAAS